jgi:hypothetical protein
LKKKNPEKTKEAYKAKFFNHCLGLAVLIIKNKVLSVIDIAFKLIINQKSEDKAANYNNGNDFTGSVEE